MIVYIVTIVLLIKSYYSYAQEKHITDSASDLSDNITLTSQPQLPAKKESNNIYNISLSIQNVTENYDKIAKQVVYTTNNKEDKLTKNTIRIFDMETKQYITVDVANFSQTDNLTAITVVSKIRNVDIVSKSKNKTNYIINDFRTIVNDTQIQKVDNTYYDSVSKTNTYDSVSKTVNSVNYSQIRTTNKANYYITDTVQSGYYIKKLKNKIIDDSKMETNYTGNGPQIQSSNITNDNETKAAAIEINSNRNDCSTESHFRNGDSITKHSSCDQVIGKICARIESLRRVRCADGTTIPLNRLCNGYSDCRNKSDEKNCEQQVGEKFKLASAILLDAETSSACLPQIVEDNSFLKQLGIWQIFLKTEWQFRSINFNESTKMISSIFDSFETQICRPIELYDVVKEDFLKIEEEFELLVGNSGKSININFSPISCTCNRQFCKSDYCDSRCRHICWQVYVLDHYGCLSVTGATSIRLDYICDGKIDCVDETDESSCMNESSTYKHRANIIYDKLLKMLSPKVVSQKYERDKIAKLRELVGQLQILTTRTPNPDINAIKILRNQYFKLLVKIFKQLWLTVHVMHDLNYAHDFLLSLNQNMVKALKSSYTGNKYLVSSVECYCKDGICASVACSRKCTEFCLAESVLSTYTCNANNTFVSIEVICDGNKDCPNGEDEKDCKHEVCRARQLDELRLTLEKAEKLLRKIVFNKVLELWKAKIEQIIISPENEEPNRKTLEHKVSCILREVVEAYSSMAASSSDHLDINLFITVSNIIKQTLKSCVIFVSTHYSYAKEKADKYSVKDLILGEIIKKISNVALNTLSKAPDDKKGAILKKIEMKLHKSAKGLVDGDKYIKIIMQEFKDKAYAKNKKKEENNKIEKQEAENNIMKNDDYEDSEIKNKTKQLRVGKKSDDEKVSTNRKVFDPRTKQKLINDIANKIDHVAKSYLRESQTLNEQKAILKKIEGRILDSSKRKHMQIHDQHSDLKAYTELITQGLALSLNRLVSKTRRMSNTESEETEIANGIGYNETHGMNIKFINRYKAFFSEVLSETSIDPRCTEVVEGICLRIESLKKLPCGDGKTVALEQVCDGVFDCWNEADETNCTHKVIDKIQRSMSLMSDIDESITTKCLQPLVGGLIFSHHHKTLLNMLKSQLDFMEHYKAPKEKYNITSEAVEDGDTFYLKKTISDATSIVSSLSSALEINLCLPSDLKAKENTLTRRSMDYEITNKNDKNISTWSPKSCTCKRDVCLFENCDARCKRICWQKYRLNRWRCQSVSGGASISLDLICDGKLDCFDESDETLCSIGSNLNKFEANVLYNELIDLLSLKSLSTEFEYSRNKLVALTGLARQLQKSSTNSNVDHDAVKILRDEYFKMLVHVYLDAMRNSNLEELDNTHNFLIVLNEKMVDALKKSHTGNVNVIPSAGCYCRNGTCVQARCPKKCHATCSVEPILTKYSCNINNLTVPIKSVCNGKTDCPNEQDEKNCLKEVCRSHHLMLLRHNLQKAGLTLQGTALGEALDSWKAKVVTMLRIIETRERPNHLLLEDTVVNILHDLVSTYASMEDSVKNSAERIFNEFVNVSNIVKETLKSCGN